MMKAREIALAAALAALVVKATTQTSQPAIEEPEPVNYDPATATDKLRSIIYLALMLGVVVFLTAAFCIWHMESM